jgi:hypothetical protein
MEQPIQAPPVAYGGVFIAMLKVCGRGEREREKVGHGKRAFVGGGPAFHLAAQV